MARTIRRVSMGTDFTNAIKRAWRSQFCPNCNVERVEEVDHIQPLQFGGDSSEENSLGLCKSCHGKKSYTENFVRNARDASGHIRRWAALRKVDTTIASDKETSLRKRFIRAKCHGNWELVKRLRKEKVLRVDTHTY